MTADEPRTAFITGAAQGLGEGFARAFLAAGYRVALADVSERVRDTAARLDPSGTHVLPLLLDVRDRVAFEAAFAAALARFGVVDVMINGTSMLYSERQDYARVFQSSHGNVDAVIDFVAKR